MPVQTTLLEPNVTPCTWVGFERQSGALLFLRVRLPVPTRSFRLWAGDWFSSMLRSRSGFSWRAAGRPRQSCVSTRSRCGSYRDR
jgi:hypothetical protein